MTALALASKRRVGLKPSSRDPGKTEFDVFMGDLGYHSDVAKAEALRLSRTVVQKIRNEGQAPSAEFIAAVRTTYPQLPYGRFFEETTRPLRNPLPHRSTR